MGVRLISSASVQVVAVSPWAVYRWSTATTPRANGTWADLDTHVAVIVDATADLGISDGIDGRASSLDVTVRAAGAIAEHYALRGERVSMQTFGARVAQKVPPGAGRVQLRRVLDRSALIAPGGTAAGSGPSPIMLALVVGLAVASIAQPDSHVAVAIPVVVVWHWIASTGVSRAAGRSSSPSR